MDRLHSQCDGVEHGHRAGSGIAEGLSCICQAFCEGVHAPVVTVIPESCGETSSFEQYLQVVRERWGVEVVLERERVKVEQLKLELIKIREAHMLLIVSGRNESTGVFSWFAESSHHV